jgi:protein-S-isoprenylcysteine O-methyltransferase Ste14
MASKGESSDSAGAIAPPPFIFFGALILGLVLNALFPLHFFPPGPLFTLVPGLPTFIVGLIVGGYEFRALNRAHTSPDPSEPTSSLVTGGPFRYTRNPIYLSFALIYLGATLAFNSLWAIALLLAVFFTIDRGQIPREERYLERTFGEEYRRYKARVRRWI